MPGFRRLPFQCGKVARRAVRHLQRGLDPVRPIARHRAFVRHHKNKFLRPSKSCLKRGKTRLRGAGDDRRLCQRIALLIRRSDRLCGLHGLRGHFHFHRLAKLRLPLRLHNRRWDRGELAGLRQRQPGLVLALVVEIFVQVFCGERLRLHSVLRHLHPRAPNDRIQHQRAKSINRPVAMIVAAGKPDAAPAVGPLDSPHQRLLLVEPRHAVLVP